MNESIIKAGETILLQTSDGKLSFNEAKSQEYIRLGKSSFSLKAVIGMPYGTVFEVQNKNIVPVSGGLSPDMIPNDIHNINDQKNNNKDYADTNTAQNLSCEKITELQEKGAAGNEIIHALIENSTTWDSKTDFSKQKYLKKKQQKYMPRFRVLKSTSHGLTRVYYEKNSQKINFLREDSIGQILLQGNIFQGAKILLFENCMGLLTAAIAERMAGEGRILAGYSGQQAINDIIRRLNFDDKTMDSIINFPIHFIGMLSKTEEQIENEQTEKTYELTVEEEMEKMERIKKLKESLGPKEFKIYEEKRNRRKNMLAKRPDSKTIRKWIREGSDSLIIATSYDPSIMLERLLPFLKISRPFIVYSQFLEPLTRTFERMKERSDLINLNLSHIWTRAYQVLPGRTHPEMKMNLCGGYILSGIKVCSDGEPIYSTAPMKFNRHNNKKKKRDPEDNEPAKTKHARKISENEDKKI